MQKVLSSQINDTFLKNLPPIPKIIRKLIGRIIRKLLDLKSGRKKYLITDLEIYFIRPHSPFKFTFGK